MNSAQSKFQIFDKIIKSLSLAVLLYPLERMQSIKQIQSTFSSAQVRHHKSIISLSIHNGLQSCFRGLMSFISKSAILTISSQLSSLTNTSSNIDSHIKNALFFGFSTVGYLMTYPLEIVNIRMSAQLERQRFYSTIKQCFSKIKKNEGVRTMYRGFFLSYSIFSIQMLSTHYILTGSFIDNESSQWKKMITIFGLLNLSQVILYPLISLKKIIQINGAIGHSDSNYNLVMALRNHNVINLWRGCELRLANILLYTLVYSLYFEKNNK